MAREKDLLRLPADFMPLDQAAVLREMLTAYRLLEDQPGLKVSRPVGLPPSWPAAYWTACLLVCRVV